VTVIVSTLAMKCRGIGRKLYRRCAVLSAPESGDSSPVQRLSLFSEGSSPNACQWVPVDLIGAVERLSSPPGPAGARGGSRSNRDILDVRTHDNIHRSDGEVDY
jgi:hypothetical protein